MLMDWMIQYCNNVSNFQIDLQILGIATKINKFCFLKLITDFAVYKNMQRPRLT